MRSSRTTVIAGVGLTLALMAGACGPDTVSPDEAADQTTTTTTEATTTTTETDGGGIGSDREAAIESFEADVRDDIGLGTGASASASTDGGYTSYVEVQDDSGLLSVEVPAEWSDVNGGEGLFGPDIIASTDVDAFQADFDVPGVEFQATGVNAASQGPADVLGRLTEGFVSLCTQGAINPYTDPLYYGVSQIFTDCNGTTTSFVWVAVKPLDESFTAVVGVQVVDDRDVDALGRILDTFVVRAG